MAKAAARRCSVCHRAGHDKRRHGARRNPIAGAGKTEAQLDAAIVRAEAKVAAALAAWRKTKTKAESDVWKRKTRAADLELEKARNARSMRRFHEHYQAQRRVPAGPLSQLRLFNPKAMFIRFGVDKNGRRRAWKSYGGSQYLREFPIGVEAAHLLVSTGQATVTGGGKLRRVNPGNPDFFRTRSGKVIPIRTPIVHVQNYDYQEGQTPPGRRSRERGGPRHGYTMQLPDQSSRIELARIRRDDPEGFQRMFPELVPKRGGRGATDTGLADRLAGGLSKTQKANRLARRRSLRGY